MSNSEPEYTYDPLHDRIFHKRKENIKELIDGEELVKRLNASVGSITKLNNTITEMIPYIQYESDSYTLEDMENLDKISKLIDGEE